MKKLSAFVLAFIIISASVLTAFASEDSQLPLTEKGELVLEDYSVIELSASDVTASEETILSFLDLMQDDLEATFPDTYERQEQVTDDLIAGYSEVYFGQKLNTVEEAKAYIRATLEEQNLKDALMTRLKEMAEAVSYPEAAYETARDYAANEIAYYAYQEGIEEDEAAILAGYGSAEEYITMQTEDYVKTSMIVNRILEDLAVSYSDEERDAALEEYLKGLGYDAYTSVEEFKETAGETWLWLFTEFQYKANLMYEALKDRIHLVK